MVFEGTSAKGQIVTLEISKIEGNPKSKTFLGNIWAKHGYIEAPIASYWFVSESVLEANGDCHADERYNLTHTDHKVNIEGMKEATSEQLAKILAHATKELNKRITTDEAEGFDDLGKVGDKEYRALEKKAKACAMKENPFLCWEWDKQACFISSSDIQGFYFPNLGTSLRCIAFRNGKAVAVFDSEMVPSQDESAPKTKEIKVIQTNYGSGWEDEAEAVREIKETAEKTATEEEREAIIEAYSSDEERLSFFEALGYFAQDVAGSCDLEEEPASYEEFAGLATCDGCTSYGAGNFYFLVSFGDWESDPIMGCEDVEEAIAYAYGSYLRAKGASL